MASKTTTSSPLKIVASAITCNAESDLPNWGDKGPAITSATAQNYISTHASCHLASDWTFQWGLGFGANDARTADDPGRTFIGTTPGGPGTAAWNTFGPTDASGSASTTVSDLQGASDVWVREALKTGYVPFSESHTDGSKKPIGQKNNVSAEMYCSNDVLNYDNYDAIYNAVLGTTYYCVGFNALASSTPTANHPPTIALIGSSTMTINIGGSFIDPGATASDTEDGDLTSHIVATGTVNVSIAGSYTRTYSVTDSGGLSASTTRTVNIVTNGGGCTTNCGGGTATDTPPIITILGDNPATITVGTDYIDAGATATDTEDGDLTSKIISTSTVATSTVGTYAVTYTVTDSGGLTSTSTRTVNVVDQNTSVGGGGNGGGGGGGLALGFGGGGIGGGAPLLATAGTAVQNPPLTCPLLNSYLRYGANNDPTEVLKLQAFLSRNQGYDVDVNGTFDLKTLAAVNAFQTKYLSDVMGPWGATRSSGYVYITTRKKINEIACDTAFVITPSEQTIIDAYKAARAQFEQNGTLPTGTSTTSPDIGLNTGSTASSSLNSFFGNPNTAGAGNASILQQFWQFLLGLFRRK